MHNAITSACEKTVSTNVLCLLQFSQAEDLILSILGAGK